MAVSTGTSLMISSTLAITLFAGMQMFKTQLSSTEYMTIFGGLLGSILFVLMLTATSNLETLMFGKGFQTRVGEVAACLMAAMFLSGLIHRVCVTTCFIFSMVALYYINKISMSSHLAAVPVKPTPKKRR